MTEYVLVFVFSLDREKVLLIRKNRPGWQAGLLNGLGGKVEKGEAPFSAAYREVEEESGLDPFKISELLHFATLQGEDYRVYCYRAKSDWTVYAQSLTDEVVQNYSVRDVLQARTSPLIPNLHYLLPLAQHLPSNVGPVVFDEGLSSSAQSVKNPPAPDAKA